jgi:GMP synthase (glutamine-hydrolysing)
MKIQYILHAEFERPGIIEIWAKEKGFEEDFCRPFVGEKIPKVNGFDLLIVMGGPQSPLQLEEAPYLKDEIELIKETVDQNKPVLGFCLGAQLIGEALGGTTSRSPHKEVGVFPITLTEEGLQDSLLKGFPQQFDVVHWHNDMPGLTSASKILAYSEGCPRQIVRYLPNVYGFQCHPEITQVNMETMIKHCSDDLAPGRYVQGENTLLSHDYQKINQKMIQFLNQFALTLSPD